MRLVGGSLLVVKARAAFQPQSRHAGGPGCSAQAEVGEIAFLADCSRRVWEVSFWLLAPTEYRINHDDSVPMNDCLLLRTDHEVG